MKKRSGKNAGRRVSITIDRRVLVLGVVSAVLIIVLAVGGGLAGGYLVSRRGTAPSPPSALSPPAVTTVELAPPQPIPTRAPQSPAVEAILTDLICPCGTCSLTVAACFCDKANEASALVGTLVEGGDSRSVVLDKLVEKYGLAILADKEELSKRQPPPGTPQPNISVSADSYDFGSISQSGVVTHVFTVRNDGDAGLVIKDVRALCACTTAAISSEEIPPGGTAELTLTYDPAYHKTVGKVTRTVVIESNDLDEPDKRVTITADVKGE